MQSAAHQRRSENLWAPPRISFWTTFFGLIVATIDDSNTSTRGGFLALPMLPLGAAILGLAQPDRVLIKILAIFLLTSSCVMPVRLLLSRVVWWEYLLALLLLCSSIWFLRKAAGRVFRLAILMYGKRAHLGGNRALDSGELNVIVNLSRGVSR